MGEVLNIRTLGLLKSQALSAEYWFSSRGRCGLPGEVCCSVCESGWAGKARVIIHLYVVIGCYHSVSGCNLEGRVWWYSSLPGVGKPLMVVVTVQGAPL
jgi:hypothetical protein